MRTESFKKHDTVVIYGSGWSLNEISEEQWDELRQFDALGFNFFAIQKWVDPNYLIIGDIRPEKKLDFSGRNIKDTYKKYYSYIKDRYKDTLFVVREKQLNLLPSEFREKYHYHVVDQDDDINHFGNNDKTLWFNKSALFAALDWTFTMKYKRVIFAGVDLYDYRFFWLPHEGQREPGTPDKKPDWAVRKVSKKHPIHKKILGWFEDHPDVVKKSGIKLFSYNERSLLLKSGLVRSWSAR